MAEARRFVGTNTPGQSTPRYATPKFSVEGSDGSPAVRPISGLTNLITGRAVSTPVVKSETMGGAEEGKGDREGDVLSRLSRLDLHERVGSEQ